MLRDAWVDLLHGGCCAGCDLPGRSLCPGCRAALPRAAYAVSPDPRPDGLATCSATGEYADLLQALVLAHKERGAHDLHRPLGELLAVAVGPLRVAGVATVLVPVPSSRAVVRGRGHDPLLRAARAAGRVLRREAGAPVGVVSLLAQRGAVSDQAGLDLGARRRNRAGSMVLREPVRRRLVRGLAGRPVVVVVVDDVLTTGATVREAQRALEVGGVPVRGVAVVAATRRRLPTGLPVVGPPH